MSAAVCRLILVRHGQTAWNHEGRLQGQQDVALDDQGLLQAQAAAQALAGCEVDAVWSSDLRRAAQTAVLIATSVDKPVYYDMALRERHYGTFEGRLRAELPALFPAQIDPTETDVLALPAPGGESRPEFYARARAGLERVAAAHAGQSIVIVTHGGVLDCAYRLARQLSIDITRDWPLRNASLNRFEFGQTGWKLVDWGNVDHLAKRTPSVRAIDRTAM